jgi:hypothetical protein
MITSRRSSIAWRFVRTRRVEEERARTERLDSLERR